VKWRKACEMTNEQRGDMAWKQSARNPGMHKVICDHEGSFWVRCSNCGFALNHTHEKICIACKQPGISDTARLFFAGKGKEEQKMDNVFRNAVDRLVQDRPKQYIFNVEVVLREEDLGRQELERAEEEIRCIGSFEVADVQILDPEDPRCL